MAGTTKEVPEKVKEQVTKILEDMHTEAPLAAGTHQLNARKAAWSITWKTDAK
jgi:hypothetical protein